MMMGKTGCEPGLFCFGAEILHIYVIMYLPVIRCAVLLKAGIKQKGLDDE